MKPIVMSLILLVLVAGMASAVSACGNTTPVQDEMVQVQSQGGVHLTPYVHIYSHGPSTAKTGETVKIDVSGELGSWVTYYWQKFYIKNLDTGGTEGVSYHSTSPGFDLNLWTWCKGGVLAMHDNFQSHWEVEFTEPGTYQVVASAVGLFTIPSGQTSFFIDVR